MTESVLVEKMNGVATILLNEPNSRNALTSTLKQGLIMTLQEINDDAFIKAVVIKGNGKTFCAGGDLKSLGEDRTAFQTKEQMDATSKIIKIIQSINKPIVAAVHGFASGAGFSIALACDFIVAEESTKFSLAFKNVGLIPDLGAHYFLANRVGPWKAKEWIMRGATIKAAEGIQYGFINEIVPNGQVLIAAQTLAAELAQGPIHAYTQTKSIINQSLSKSLDEVIELENFAQSLLRGTKDNIERMEAFFSKRRPIFTGE
jgi:2-(1,2-epoxy-1,2-dihydrophenyl)acetyl-CoA isomerase